MHKILFPLQWSLWMCNCQECGHKHQKCQLWLNETEVYFTHLTKKPTVSSYQCWFSSLMIAGNVSLLLLVALSLKATQCSSSSMSAFRQEGEEKEKVAMPGPGVQKAPQETWLTSPCTELCCTTTSKWQGRCKGRGG